MLVHPVTDEILERLWYLHERGAEVATVDDLKIDASGENLRRALEELIDDRAVASDPSLKMLPAGEERARGIIRRHRLAEILFSEVLEVDWEDAEASACEFEHMLSERVVDRVCTFLGHPPKCPHGLAIPSGSCCGRFDRRVDPLVSRLSDLPISGSGRIVFMTPASSWLNRLSALGIVPGTEVKLMQRKPSIVISCGQTSVAIEDEIA
ncbi:MAG: metal-dependent transcriptional regulator, partial [Thermoanaerobaculia bacterium]|nr:metal-dependent transcriptional regulator [Thermoanaerobaculia bacterium]